MQLWYAHGNTKASMSCVTDMKCYYHSEEALFNITHKNSKQACKICFCFTFQIVNLTVSMNKDINCMTAWILASFT